MSKRKVFNKQGDEVWLDDAEILPDGYSIRVPAFLCDGVPPDAPRFTDSYGNEAGHRPGFIVDASTQCSDAREAARAEYIATLTDSWKTPSRAAAPASSVQQVSDRKPDDKEAAHAEMTAWLRDAWRSSPRSPRP